MPQFTELLENYLRARDEFKHATGASALNGEPPLLARAATEKKTAFEAATAQLNDYMWRLEP